MPIQVPEWLRRMGTAAIAILALVWRILTTRTVKMIILISLIIALVGLPILAGTRTYPVAVVDGTSMSPTLHNGDLVFYASPKGPITIGTIIVFIQSDTGVGAFDAFLKPIIIHRVISVGQEPNGIPSYQTKGDNNQAPDPFITDRANVLGTPILVVPSAGYPIQFFKTAYGMLMIASLVSLYFFSGVDTRIAREEARKRLTALLARHSLNGEISPSQFERLNMAMTLEDGDGTFEENVRDSLAQSMINWLRIGGLENEWTEDVVECPACRSRSFLVKGGDAHILICPSCEKILPDKTGPSPDQHQPETGLEGETQSPPEPGVYPTVETPSDSSQQESSPSDNETRTNFNLTPPQELDLSESERPESALEEATDRLTDAMAGVLQEHLHIGQSESPVEKDPWKRILKVKRDKAGWESRENTSEDQSE